MTNNSMPKREKKVCTVPYCPERYRCLDKETPTHCAVYRMYQKNKGVSIAPLPLQNKPYTQRPIIREDGEVFGSIRQAARAAGCSYYGMHSLLNDGGGIAKDGLAYRFGA